MDQVMGYINAAIEAMQDGFLRINQPQGLIIALIAALLMPGWRQWPIFALLATAVHLAVDHLPQVLGTGRLPDNLIQESFWTDALGYFIGYLIIIGVFFFVKSLVSKRSGGHAKAH